MISKMNWFVVVIGALPAISAESNDAAIAATDAFGNEDDAAAD